MGYPRDVRVEQPGGCQQLRNAQGEKRHAEDLPGATIPRERGLVQLGISLIRVAR